MALRDICLVLDLDNTLINSDFDYDDDDADLTRVEIIEHYDGDKALTYFRPHLEEFLRFSKEHFKKVILWSAGQDDYVLKLAHILEKKAGIRFDNIFSRSNCYYMKKKDKYLKPVSFICKKLGPGWFEEKFVLIDDSEKVTTGILNHIWLSCWTGDMEDTILKDLVDIFTGIKKKRISSKYPGWYLAKCVSIADFALSRSRHTFAGSLKGE